MATRLNTSYHEEFTLSQAYSRAYGQLRAAYLRLAGIHAGCLDASSDWPNVAEKIARELEDNLTTVIFDASLRAKLARRE